MKTCLSVVLAAASLVGCSGDARPLEEAVEVRELGLETLSIRPPEGTLSPLVVNPGESVPFTLVGGGGGREFEVDGTARRWSVTDPNVASIDEDGQLVARADGRVAVEARIGNVVAPGFDVTVFQASVERIDSIGKGAADAGEGLDPCVPERFVATGLFTDGSTRQLRSVEWSVQGSGVVAEGLEDGGVRLYADTPGAVELRATVNQATDAVQVQVADTLRTLAVGPAGNLVQSVGGTRELTATGTYADAAGNGVLREIDVTRSVDWAVTSGPDVATVTTGDATRGDATRGVVTASRAGTAQIVARCGAVASDPTSFTVSAATEPADSATGLSFEDAINGTLAISISDFLARNVGSIRLRVSTGSPYDVDSDVTDQATWQLLDSSVQGGLGTTVDLGTGLGTQTTVGTLDTDGLDRGTFTPTSVGIAEVRVRFGERSATLTINVDP